MNELFEGTRDIIRDRYALRTPRSFVATPLPGWQKTQCHVLISPAMGARFSALLMVLENEGQCMGNTGANQYFIYALEGPSSILLDDRRHRLEPGSYVYLPPGKDVQIKSAGPASRILIFQTRYQALAGVARPPAFVNHQRDVKAEPFQENNAVQCQALMPEDPAFDLSVNLFTLRPGATWKSVRALMMEMGLVMLQGCGIFRLNTEWLPVQAGDVLWAAPFCPQWFAAVGNGPASYISCQDVNRDPM